VLLPPELPLPGIRPVPPQPVHSMPPLIHLAGQTTVFVRPVL
jgi:hypothetical protein